MTESEAKGIGLLINQLARQERELAAARAGRDAARAEVERCHLHAPNRERELEKTLADLDDTRALLPECRAHIAAAGHLPARCEYSGPCEINACGRDDLLQRIDAALGEER